MKARIRLIFLVFFSLVLAFYVVGCSRIGLWLVKDEVPAHADALVILMGNFPDRVLQAFDLWSSGEAERIIIVNESMGAYRDLKERGVNIISQTEQAKKSCIALGIPVDKITVLPGDARSTLTEALIIRDYLQQNVGIDTIVLVSSPSHMRRASLIFNRALRNLEQPVFVGCSPSLYSDFNANGWWTHKEDIQAVLSELLKIMSFRLVEQWGLKE